MLFLLLPGIFCSLPHQITLKFDISRNKFPFTLNNSFCFASTAEREKKTKCFRYANHLTPFPSFLACYLSFLSSHMSLFFVDVMLSHSKAIFVRRKKVVDKNFLNLFPCVVWASERMRDTCLHKNHIKLHERTMPFHNFFFIFCFRYEWSEWELLHKYDFNLI